MTEQAFKIPKTGIRIQHIDGSGSTLIISGSTLPLTPVGIEEGAIFIAEDTGLSHRATSGSWETVSGGGGGSGGFAKDLWEPIEQNITPTQTPIGATGEVRELTVNHLTNYDDIVTDYPYITGYPRVKSSGAPYFPVGERKAIYYTFPVGGVPATSQFSYIYIGFAENVNFPEEAFTGIGRNLFAAHSHDSGGNSELFNVVQNNETRQIFQSVYNVDTVAVYNITQDPSKTSPLIYGVDYTIALSPDNNLTINDEITFIGSFTNGDNFELISLPRTVNGIGKVDEGIIGFTAIPLSENDPQAVYSFVVENNGDSTVTTELYRLVGSNYVLLISGSTYLDLPAIEKMATISISNESINYKIITNPVGYGIPVVAGTSIVTEIALPNGLVDETSYPTDRENSVYMINNMAYPLISTVGLLSNGDYVVFDSVGALAGKFSFEDYRFVEDNDWTPDEYLTPPEPAALIESQIISGSSSYGTLTSNSLTVTESNKQLAWSAPISPISSTEQGTYFNVNIQNMISQNLEYVMFGFIDNAGVPTNGLGLLIQQQDAVAATHAYIDIQFTNLSDINNGTFITGQVTVQAYSSLAGGFYHTYTGNPMFPDTTWGDFRQDFNDIYAGLWYAVQLNSNTLRIYSETEGNLGIYYVYGAAYGFGAATSWQDGQDEVPEIPLSYKLGNVVPPAVDSSAETSIPAFFPFSPTDEIGISVTNTGNGLVKLYKNGTLIDSYSLQYSIDLSTINRVGMLIWSESAGAASVSMPATPMFPAGFTQFFGAPQPSGEVDINSYPSEREGKAFVVSGMPAPLLSTGGIIKNSDIVVFSPLGEIRKILRDTNEPFVFYVDPYNPSTPLPETSASSSTFFYQGYTWSDGLYAINTPNGDSLENYDILSVEAQYYNQFYSRWVNPRWAYFSSGTTVYGLTATLAEFTYGNGGGQLYLISGANGLAGNNATYQGSPALGVVYSAYVRIKVVAKKRV